MAAILKFPHAAAIYYCHGCGPWEELPPTHRRIYRYAAVSNLFVDWFRKVFGIDEEMIEVVHNGIDLSRASRLSARVVARTPLYEPLVEASDLYETSGLPFAEALKKKAVFDPQVVHMIGIGEKSASLPEQLEMLRDIYEDDTSQAMTDFTQIINLITLLIACILIGAVFAGAMLPIFLMGPRMMDSA